MNVKALRAAAGGVVSVGSGPPTPAQPQPRQEIKAELKRAYDTPGQQTLIDDLTAMLEKQENSECRAAGVPDEARATAYVGTGEANRDDKAARLAEGALGNCVPDEWRGLLETLGDRAHDAGTERRRRRASAIRSRSSGPARRTRCALRTYWQMKERAGVVGTNRTRRQC